MSFYLLFYFGTENDKRENGCNLAVSSAVVTVITLLRKLKQL